MAAQMPLLGTVLGSGHRGQGGRLCNRAVVVAEAVNQVLLLLLSLLFHACTLLQLLMAVAGQGLLCCAPLLACGRSSMACTSRVGSNRS